MAINLASKYAKKIATGFTHASYVAGKYSTDYSFEGVRSINIWTPTTVALSDYNRAASSGRFGALTEMQDTLQTLTMTQEKAFSISIDKANNSDQMMMKRAGRMMSLQIAEQVVPVMDKYALKTWSDKAGTMEVVGSLTKTNIVEKVLNAAAALDDEQVPDTGRILYIKANEYNKIRLSNEFVNLPQLGAGAIRKGDVGDLALIRVVKVPSSFLPEDVPFLLLHKSAVLRPVKLKTARILKDDKDVDGWILQGHWYYDAFVLDAKKKGVYTALAAARTTQSESGGSDTSGDDTE